MCGNLDGNNYPSELRSRTNACTVTVMLVTRLGCHTSMYLIVCHPVRVITITDTTADSAKEIFGTSVTLGTTGQITSYFRLMKPSYSKIMS